MRNLQQLLSLIDNYSKANSFPAQLPELYDPCAYILQLGGKRIRPALVLMGYELFRDDLETALPVAWAVELFHNFTLIHDDIMDNAPLRRGQATVHAKWSSTTAILSGDVMLIQAYRFLAQSSHSTERLMAIFNRVATEVCEGQQMDINFESRAEVGIPEYLNMIALKTAVLLGAALELGATCAHASPADATRLREFGRLAGIAFQIQDDLLDTYGNPEKFGKQVGGDILQNKKTLLVLKTLEIASEAGKQELRHWMGQGAEAGAEKVAAVRAIFDRNQIPELISAEKLRFQSRAFEHLEAVQVPTARKEVLRKTIEDLLERDN